MESMTIQEKLIGLDSLSRSTMKLFVHDILHLKPVDCPSLKHTSLLSYKGHVVNRVEVMGIVVREDMREIRHSYAVDDGTGVIQCTFWKNSRHGTDKLSNIPRDDLPRSLQQKLDQMKAASVARNEESFDIGDLVLVRGCVKTFRGQLEVDVLDHRKLENPCLEYQRVLKMPSFYKIYNRPVKLPEAIEKSLQSSAHNAFNTDAVQCAIAQEIQACFCSPATECVFTPSCVLSWPAVAELLLSSKKDQERPATASVSERVSTIRSALLGLESRGWVFCRGSQHSQSHSHSHSHSQSQSHSRDADRFEIITSQSPLSKHVLSVLRDACLHSLKNSETGCHLLNLLDRIQQSGRQGAAGVYKSVTKLILERALTCLIISSDVIEVDHQRYLPVE